MKASESPYRELFIVPTGYAALDKILGRGGVPLRKITEISGPWGVGKSTIALSIVAQAQKLGLPVLWVDTEFSFEEEYSRILGVNPEELDLIQERIGEDMFDATERWIIDHRKGLVVLDSIGGILPRSEAEKNAEQKSIGARAKLVSSFCLKAVPLLSIQNIGLIVLNHEITDLMSGRLKTSGGEKLAYHKTIWLRLKKANERILRGEQQVGEVITAEIRKNKIAGTMKQECKLQMLFGEGFNKQADLMQDALDKGIITKKGNTYYLGNEKIGRGLPKLREAFKDEAFTAKVISLMKEFLTPVL